MVNGLFFLLYLSKQSAWYNIPHSTIHTHLYVNSAFLQCKYNPNSLKPKVHTPPTGWTLFAVENNLIKFVRDIIIINTIYRYFV